VVSVSDDDWFERALRERDDGDGGSDERSADVESDSNAAGTADESGPDDERPGTTGRPSGSASEEPGVAGDTDRSADDDPKGSDDTDGSPFSRDFASALEDAPDPNTGSEGPGAGGGGPFGGGSNGDDPLGGDSTDPFGGGSGGDGTDPLGGGGGDGFGFDGFGGDEPESFDEDEAEFDSNLDRLDVGIDGLDQMILGGVPERSLMVAIGSAGTGKTTFGLQFLNQGLAEGENGVYITLEEGFERIVSTADEKGWGFREYVDDDRLAVVDIDPVEMSNSLDSIQNDLPDLIEEFGADRLVLDSVSLLEMMYESAPRRRSQVFGFARALKQAGITTLLTSEADRNHAYASRYGIVEYLADAVFVLRYVRPSDFRETRLAIEIQKIRNANHSRETKPYDLTDDGINVYRQANIF
jgi:KaiC domain protein